MPVPDLQLCLRARGITLPTLRVCRFMCGTNLVLTVLLQRLQIFIMNCVMCKFDVSFQTESNKKLSCRRETARRFVLLNILLGHSRSFEMILLSRACVSHCQYSIGIMSVSRSVSEIFSVKEWRDLETGGRGLSRSLKMAPFDRSYKTFYWSAIVNIALSCTVFE